MAEMNSEVVSTAPTSWFEFLLDETLLEKHLSKINAEAAADLISLFLHQANIAASTAREIISKETSCNGLDTNNDQMSTGVEKQPNGFGPSAGLGGGLGGGATGGVPGGGGVVGGLVENKKIKQLKLLALKTASYLKWDLDTLGNYLPIYIQQILLQVLASMFNGDLLSSINLQPTPGERSRGFSEMSPDELFAFILYHRWWLRSVVKDSFPKKPSKQPNVNVPGLFDPNVLFAQHTEPIMKTLKETVDSAISMLSNYSLQDQETRRPVLESFGSVLDDTTTVVHNWNFGVMISRDEMTCRVRFDLGAAYFYQQNFEKAFYYFEYCKNFGCQVDSLVDILGAVDAARLDGYLNACSSLLPVSSSPWSKPDTHALSSSHARVNASVKNNFQGLAALLIEDLIKQELSLTFRAHLEELTQCATRTDSLREEVLVCNMIRRCLDGRVATFDLVRTLNSTNGLVAFFVQVCLEVHRYVPTKQKESLKLLLRNLCHTLSAPCADFTRMLLSGDLQSLFTTQELDEIRASILPSGENITIDTGFNFPPPVDETVKIAELERELLVSYDPPVIKDLVQKLITKIGKVQTLFLTDQWRLSVELQQCFESLLLPQPAMSVYTHILVAKSHICLRLLQYDKARELLSAADIVVKDVSYKLSRLLRWETLKVDLDQYNDTESFGRDSTMSDLVKRSKACITSLHIEPDLQPSEELVCAAVALLLNNSEWDYFITLSHVTNIGYLQFHRDLDVMGLQAAMVLVKIRRGGGSSQRAFVALIISQLCKELPLVNRARAAARDFINAVQLTFSSGPGGPATVPNIRPLMGGVSAQQQAQRDMAILSQDTLAKFILRIKEPTVLSVFISCLTRLFNLLRADVSDEIFSDYIMLWPTTLATNKLNVVAVTDLVNTIIRRLLTVNPNNASWLRTQADLCYVQGQFWLALKYYLQVGVTSTDYFTEPVTRNVYDDNVYKRMIRCCTSLNCHTQAALLCQVFEETDYTVAFKCLQEHTTNDAMDAYYDCIWDPTLLEYLINLHCKRGEVDKRQYCLQLIGQMELNSSNRPEILSEAARVRKSRLLRAMARQYLGVTEQSETS